MAGIYGRLSSHADFQRVLTEALETATRGLAIHRTGPATAIVARQLKAMRNWTANGRTPTEDEQSRIDIGLIASREFSDTGRAETEEWANQSRELDNFFQGWPTDTGAASSTASDAEAYALIARAGDRKRKARRLP